MLHACEAAIGRLATDGRYFARPARTLFNDIRIYFPISAQHRVYRVIDYYVRLAQAYFEEQALRGFDLDGKPLQCRATTRKGTRASAPAAAQRLLPLAPAPGGDGAQPAGIAA